MRRIWSGFNSQYWEKNASTGMGVIKSAKQTGLALTITPFRIVGTDYQNHRGHIVNQRVTRGTVEGLSGEEGAASVSRAEPPAASHPSHGCRQPPGSRELA